MAALILFRCPETGLEVETLLERQDKDRPPRAYEALVCPVCTRLHFIDAATGKLLGGEKTRRRETG
jgi:hypothetical protein